MVQTQQIQHILSSSAVCRGRKGYDIILVIILSVCLFVAGSGMSYGQSQKAKQKKVEVSGEVMDQNLEPLAGAFVRILGTDNGTTADGNGKFSITAPAGSELEFRFMGFASYTLTVTAKMKPVTIIMTPDKDMMLDEAVTIAYGSVKKRDLTGSVANVKMGNIKDAPVLSVDQALQGRVAGADIMSTTGEPGSATSIRIRGTRSIIASNEPLIVVDGVIDAVYDLGDINPADILSISVLKDASSTAIYGARGSNGVILVTTRKGEGNSGKPRINFRTDIGFSQLPRKLDLMNASEYAQYRNDLLYFSNMGGEDDLEGKPLSEYRFSDPLSKGKGTDWIEEITRIAPYQNYNVSMSGSSKKSSFYVSLGYNDTRGIIKRSGMTRYTGRINLDYTVFKWLKAGYKGSFTYRHQDRNLTAIGGTSTRNAAIYLSPLLTPKDNYNTDYEDGITYNPPTATMSMNTDYANRSSSNHSVYFEIEPVKNLVFHSQNSFYDYQYHRYRYYPSTLPAKNEGEGGDAYRQENDSKTYSSENTVFYKIKRKGHSFDVLAGFTAYMYMSNALSISGSGYMDDNVKWNNLGGVLDKDTLSPSSSASEITKMSMFARINYNWKRRYYITMTGRYDGASNFAANNKWGFFPSAAVKWAIKREPFMKDISWIDDLSLRISAGRTGNDAVSAYRSLEALTSTTSSYLFGGAQQSSFYRSRLASPDLTWEKTDLYNAAIDASFFNARISLNAEAYISKTSDLLMDVEVAAQTGFSSQFINLGKTTNMGLEFSIESRNIVKKNFTWSSSFTISHNRQNVDDIGTSEFVPTATSNGNNPYMMHGYVKGYPLNAVWGFKYAGVWHSTEEFIRNETTHAYVSASTITSGNYSSNLGIPRYYDINNDGSLDQQDLVYLGNADPDIYGGLQNDFSIGNFKIGLFLAYSIGGKIYNYSELAMSGGKRTNQYAYMTNSWHPVRNPTSNLPRAGGNSASVPCDRMVYDASYFRVKSCTIGYTFDLDRCKWLRDLTVSVSGENLWLLKNYNGFDPDVSTSSDDSTLRRLDIGAYPKARTLVFSLQVRY